MQMLDLKIRLDVKVKDTKKTWLKAVVEQSRKVGLNEDDASKHIGHLV